MHKLKPGDIDAVAALGDSISAGWAAGTDSLLLDVGGVEWRGLAWSAGGEGNFSEYLTLPNVLEQFNPNLKGASHGIKVP